MSETIHEESLSQQLPPAIGELALHSIAHFYDADGITIPLKMGDTVESTDQLTVIRRRDGTRTREVVGVGSKHDTMLQDSLQKMRTLETVRTRPVARIELGQGQSIDFTSLEHYNPRIAPSSDTYPVPTWAGTLLAGKTFGANMTYQETIKHDDWQQEVRSVIDEYVQEDADGKALMDHLRIKSLDHLSPQQAVKLSVALVQNLSKYSPDHVGKFGYADTKTTAALLRDGLVRKYDPTWLGNGVCRNIASNVKAVFEALKATQAEYSMLNNTYAVFNGGLAGSGYADKRRDAATEETSAGHAWDTFVTFDEHGSAAATIVDATWGLGKDNYTSLEHLDFTYARMAAPMVNLFEQSTDKQAAFDDIAYYLDMIASRRVPGRNFDQHMDTVKYVATEYLKIAGKLRQFPENYQTSPSIRAAIYRTREQLTESEIGTVFKLHEADPYSLDDTTCRTIIHAYVTATIERNSPAEPSKGLIFGDSSLMRMVDAALTDEQRTKLMANTSYGMRIKNLR